MCNFSDPFGLKIEWKNDDDGTLQRNWNHAKRAVQELADGGDEQAQMMLKHMLFMETTDDVYTIQNAALSYGRGATSDDGMTISVDVAKVARSRATEPWQLNVASVLVHETGHSAYRSSPMGRVRRAEWESEGTALGFENAYRGAVGWCARANHNSYPRRGCTP